MEIKRAYRFRFYPTPEQETTLARTFGRARFAYNHMLRLRTDAWFKEQKRVGYHETSAALTLLKKLPEFAWLNEVSSVPVRQALRHLQTAFANFFVKRAGYPTFRGKRDRQAAEYITSAFKWDGKALKLAKRDEPLAIRWSRTLPKAAKLTTVAVSKDAAGRYFVSLLCDDAVQARPEAAGKVARMHARAADARRDFLHKLSTRLVHENPVIAIESLAVSNMQKNRCLSKSIADAGWAQFVRQLEYKSLWHGRELIGIDRWYPSSKRCGDRGHTVARMPLNAREWVCPECGSVHDRDVNAARNVLAAGLAVSALGEAVSPVCI